jgi:hypothetical protein
MSIDVSWNIIKCSCQNELRCSGVAMCVLLWSPPATASHNRANKSVREVRNNWKLDRVLKRNIDFKYSPASCGFFGKNGHVQFLATFPCPLSLSLIIPALPRKVKQNKNEAQRTWKENAKHITERRSVCWAGSETEFWLDAFICILARKLKATELRNFRDYKHN